MFLYSNKKKNREINNISSINNGVFNLNDFLTGKESTKNVESESTYYTCLRLLSETLSKLELKLYKKEPNGGSTIVNDTVYYNLLNPTNRPTKYLSSIDFWTLMEKNRNHFGNAYAYISKKLTGGVEFVPLNPQNVQIFIDDKGLWEKNQVFYTYACPNTGQTYRFVPEDVIHLKNFDTDSTGLVGISVREKLFDSIDNLKQGQDLINNLYKNGLHSRAILQYTGSYDFDKGADLKNRLQEAMGGVKGAGGVIPIPVGFQLQPFAISLTDAQFLEVNKFTALQIISAFGLKAHQINNLDKSSYSTLEQQQLDFYINTISVNITRYEQEINYKVLSEDERKNGYFFKFDAEPLLKGDFKSQIEGFAKAINNAVYTPNEAREKLNLPKTEDGNVLMCNSNYIPLGDVQRRSNNTLNNGLLQQQALEKELNTKINNNEGDD